MKHKGILHYIRLTQLKRILYPVLFLALVFAILFNLPFFDFLALGSIGADTPLSEAVNSRRKYVRTQARDLYYTGDDCYINGVLTGHYYYQLNDSGCRIYILKPQAGRPAEPYIEKASVTGKLEKFTPASDPLFEDLAGELNWTVEGLTSVCDPYCVNQAYRLPALQIVLLVITVLALIAGMISLFYMLLLLAFPKLSVTYRRLKNYGNADDILDDAEDEILHYELLRQGNMILTPKYLTELSAEQSFIVPLESVLWVFHTRDMRFSVKDKRRRMYYALWIITIAGDNFILKNRSKAEIDTIMDVLTDRYPNFFYDYSEEQEKMVRYILRESKRELAEKKNR